MKNKLKNEPAKPVKEKKYVVIFGIIFVVVIAFLVGGYYLYKKNTASVEDLNFENAIKEFYIDYNKLSINPNNHPRPDELLNKIREEEAMLSDDDPDNDRTAYELIAFNSRTLGDEEGAIRGYRASLSIVENNTLALNNLATSYKDLKEYKNAEMAYKRLIAFSPGSVDAYRKLADLYLIPQVNKKDRVIPTLEIGLQAVPNAPDLLSYLAVYYKDEKDYIKAIEYYEKLLKVYPGNEAARQDLNTLKILTN